MELPAQADAFHDRSGLEPIGAVLEIGGMDSRVGLDLARLRRCADRSGAALALAGEVGSQIKIPSADGWLIASVRALRLDPDRSGAVVAAVDFLGEGRADDASGEMRGFRRGITRYPVPGTPAFAVSDDDLRQIYAGGVEPRFEVGTVYPTRGIRGSLQVDAMLGKHFALLGSTGTGKSTAAALILHRICELAPEGHIVMIDPHGEYPAAFAASGHLLDVSNLQMPYWLMNFEEHAEVFVTSGGAERAADREVLARCLRQARAKNRLAQTLGRLTVDTPVPYLLSDLLTALQNEMGKLDKASSSAPFLRLKARIEEIKADPRYQFMFSGMLVSDTMGDFLGRVFRLPAEGKPITIIDVSGVPSEITATVVAVLARLVFDFAVWSRGDVARPILLVCEEAHRYVPGEHNADGSSAGRILSRIAKEGRKYGIALGLITQRPSDLAEGVLSQCGTIIAMRLNNERDQAFVRAAMPEGSRGFLDAIPALRNREAIVCGEGVTIPLRVAFDDLEASKRPASADPSFAALWQASGGEQESIARAVARWRGQGR